MKKFVEKIECLEEKYKEKMGKKYMKNEEEILNLRNKKYFTLSELKKIVKWKNFRDNHSVKNSNSDVQEITKECF